MNFHQMGDCDAQSFELIPATARQYVYYENTSKNRNGTSSTFMFVFGTGLAGYLKLSKH